jgi:hypothetical protein
MVTSVADKTIELWFAPTVPRYPFEKFCVDCGAFYDVALCRHCAKLAFGHFSTAPTVPSAARRLRRIRCKGAFGVSMKRGEPRYPNEAALSMSHRTLLCRDPGRLDDRPPLLDLGLVVGAERLRRLLITWENLLSKISEPRTHKRIGQCTYD